MCPELIEIGEGHRGRMGGAVASEAAIGVGLVSEGGGVLMGEAGGDGVGVADGSIMGGVCDEDGSGDAARLQDVVEGARGLKGELGEGGLDEGEAADHAGREGGDGGGDEAGAKTVAGEVEAEVRLAEVKGLEAGCEAQGSDLSGAGLHLKVRGVVDAASDEALGVSGLGWPIDAVDGDGRELGTEVGDHRVGAGAVAEPTVGEEEDVAFGVEGGELVELAIGDEAGLRIEGHTGVLR